MQTVVKLTKPQMLFIVFGLLVMWGLALHQYLMFIRAYMSPQKAIVLYINYFGEANAEIVMMTFSMVVGTIVTGYILWFLNGVRKGRRNGSCVCDTNCN